MVSQAWVSWVCYKCHEYPTILSLLGWILVTYSIGSDGELTAGIKSNMWQFHLTGFLKSKQFSFSVWGEKRELVLHLLLIGRTISPLLKHGHNIINGRGLGTHFRWLIIGQIQILPSIIMCIICCFISTTTFWVRSGSLNKNDKLTTISDCEKSIPQHLKSHSCWETCGICTLSLWSILAHTSLLLVSCLFIFSFWN